MNNYLINTFLRWFAANALPQSLFEHQTSMDRIKGLFSSYVRIVEVENHSYCNRTCWFCPNSSIDRRSKNILMPQGIFHKILDDLSLVDYDQSFVFCGYCESLSDESIFENVAWARRKLPKAYIKIYSNGDYLTDERIRHFEKNGLNQIRISLYPISEDQEEIKELLKSLSKRTGLYVVKRTSRYRGLQLAGSSILIPIEIKNFRPSQMSSRGGYFSKETGSESYVRTALCFEPLKHLTISFDGKCMMCCQLRPDIPKHSSGIIGDLNKEGYSLFHYYQDLATARGLLLKPGPKTGICRHCDHNFLGAGPFTTGRHPIVAAVLNKIPFKDILINKSGLYPRLSRKRYTQF